MLLLLLRDHHAHPFNAGASHGRDLELQTVEPQGLARRRNVLQPFQQKSGQGVVCLLYTSDAADD